MLKWNDDNTITVPAPKKPKKVTGTRLAAVMDLNKWSSPFEAWCAITRTYEKPFEDTIYTIAGKTIEPKQAEYMKDKYFWKSFLTPTDKYGKDYFRKTWGDFFPEDPIYGGMWDYLFTDKDGKPTTVLEMKTTKRIEDWAEDIPEYYAMQAALYAYLLDVDDVIMVCTVLTDEDYEHPEKFIVTEQNTFERNFKVSERYPQMKEIIALVRHWWEEHVLTGISPEYDEKRDAEILAELRKNTVNPQTEVDALVREAEELKAEIDGIKAQAADAEKRYKKVTDMLKQIAKEQFREGDKQVEIPGQKYTWIMSKSVTKKVNEDLLKEDGIYEKYLTESESYRFAPKENK
jgi:predicted phage-related endonuclease